MKFLSQIFKSFQIEMRSQSGVVKSKRLALKRSLSLGGFFEAWSSQNVNLESVADFSQSAISIKPDTASTLISFPSTLRVRLAGQSIFEPSPTAAPHRVTLSQKGFADKLEFAFPNGSELAVSVEPPTREDWKMALRGSLPIGWVSVGHLVVLFLMLLSFSMPSKHFEPVDDLSKLSVEVRDIQTGALVGGPASSAESGPVTKELLAMQRALKSFGLKKTQPALTGKKYAGFESTNADRSGGTRIQPLIGFTGPGGSDGTPLNISEAEISRLLGGVNQQLKECYDDALIQDSSLQGRPQVVISVAKAGRVEGINLNYVKGNSKSLAVLSACFRSTLQKLKFPEANQAFAVTQTLVLTR